VAGPLSSNGKGQETRAAQYIDWAVRVLIVAGVAFGYDIAQRLTRIETKLSEEFPPGAEIRAFMDRGDRFTTDDGHALEEEIKAWTDGQYLKDSEWLREDLSEIKQSVSVLPSMNARLTALEARVKDLEK
jgi:hypothetical protein